MNVSLSSVEPFDQSEYLFIQLILKLEHDWSMTKTSGDARKERQNSNNFETILLRFDTFISSFPRKLRYELLNEMLKINQLTKN